MQVLLPPGWPRPRGYANGVAAQGRQVFIAGMIGWDAQGRFQTDDFSAQARQALQHIVAVLAEAQALAADLVAGPTFANGMTKTMLQHEWAMTIEQAIESEAQAQALCMLTQDFHRAYHAFVARQKPVFQGD